MNNFLIDNPVLQSLNKKERAILDANNGEIRDRILWYTERVGHYREAIKNGSVGMTIYPLEQDYQPITLDQAKFQYTFWFEAMVWYIRTQIDVKEQPSENKAKAEL